MNQKDAKKITALHNHRLTPVGSCSCSEAKGFLKAIEKFNPVVERLETLSNALPPNAISMEVGKVLKIYRRDVLGEEEK